MIEFRIGNVKIKLFFSFFSVISLFLMFDKSRLGAVALLSCGIHEISHLIAMQILNVPVKSVSFYGAGIKISSPDVECSGTFRELAVLGAGCFANFVCALLFWLIGNSVASMINLLMGVFNLFPIGELDGAVLVRMFILRNCKPENLDKYANSVAIVFLLFLIILLIAFGKSVSFTLVTTALYIVFICFFEK